MTEIIPAILATTEEQYKKDLQKLQQSPSLEGGWMHVDFMDGVFVENKSIDPEVVGKSEDGFKKEAHLMVLRSMDFLDKLIESKFERVILHIESEEVEKCVEYLKGKGLEVGLALKLDTPLEKLEPFLSKINVVLLMSIEPGFQGQPFKEEVYGKVEVSLRLRSENNYSYLVAVDGHVDNETAKKLVDAGVDNLVVGSYFIKADDVEEKLEEMWENIRG